MPGWMLQIITRFMAAVAALAVDWLVGRGLLDAGGAAEAAGEITTAGVAIVSALTVAVYGIIRPLLSRLLHPADNAEAGTGDGSKPALPK